MSADAAVISDSLETREDPRTDFEKKYVYYDEESGVPRVNRKNIIKDPFVLFGFGGTCAALIRGLHYFRLADSKNQQLMMRYRVGFQALTILAIALAVRPTPLTKEQQEEATKVFFYHDATHQARLAKQEAAKQAKQEAARASAEAGKNNSTIEADKKSATIEAATNSATIETAKKSATIETKI